MSTPRPQSSDLEGTIVSDGDAEFEIDEKLDELREEAANEQVEQLLDIIEKQQREIRRLRSTDRNRQRRLKRLERRKGILSKGDEIDDLHFDYRDEKVLEVLATEQPDKVSIQNLKKLYGKRTDVRAKDTLRDRVKYLIEQGPFEKEPGERVATYLGA